MSTKSDIEVNAPGRICLFGDHQDYLNLPVIACAIDRYIYLKASINSSAYFNINMPDIGAKRKIHIEDAFDILNRGDYFASALRVLKRYGCVPNIGYNITISGNIPLNAGLSSSSALIVTWVRFLVTAFGVNRDANDSLIAKIAFESEVLEHNGPGGFMDQYSIALGGVLYIETGAHINFKQLNSTLNCCLIIGESGVKKETLETLTSLKEKAQRSFSVIKKGEPNFDYHKVSLEDAIRLQTQLEDDLKPIFYAAIKNHQITKEALRVLEDETKQISYLGELMSQHHTMLRDNLKITVPKIDKMIDAALRSGSYGAKIVGSGDGGCIVALASEENKAAVIDAIKLAGAANAYEVSIA